MIQNPLLSFSTEKHKSQHEFEIINWNVRNPSLECAKRQIRWIFKRHCDVLILTEIKLSKGLNYIIEQLRIAGYYVECSISSKSEYGSLVASNKHPSNGLSLEIDFLPSRVASISLGASKPITVVGVYVPSRGKKENRNVNKRIFQDKFISSLKMFRETHPDTNLIVGGDLNVIERSHSPQYKNFGDWEYRFYDGFAEMGLVDAFRAIHPNTNEYSWFGRSGNGYRFDHWFVSKRLTSQLSKCIYMHEPRKEGLSDHSALYLSFKDWRVK